MIEEHFILASIMNGNIEQQLRELTLTRSGSLYDSRAFPYAASKEATTIWEVMPAGYSEVQNTIVPGSLSNSELYYNNTNGHFYERTTIEIEDSLIGQQKTKQILHFGIKGDLPEIWQNSLDTYLWSQYGPDGNNYITSSGPNRNSSEDLIAWITNQEGEIIASLGLERILEDCPHPFFDGQNNDTFSSMKFFQNAMNRDLLKRLSYPDEKIDTMTLSSVGELTRFTVIKYPKSKELPQKVRRIDRGLIALCLANGIYRNNELSKRNIHPNVRPINWVFGNIIHDGPARSTVDKFLNGSVRFITKENNPSLSISPSALDESIPEGYAAEYMRKNAPKLVDGMHKGLSIFIADISNEIVHTVEKGRFVADMLKPLGYHYQVFRFLLTGVVSSILK